MILIPLPPLRSAAKWEEEVEEEEATAAFAPTHPEAATAAAAAAAIAGFSRLWLVCGRAGQGCLSLLQFHMK